MAIHVCHICQSAGGVETYLLHLLRHCDRAAFRHTVLCYTNGALSECAKDEGADVIIIPMVREISPFKDGRSLVRLLATVRELRPHIIHAHSGKGGVFGRLCGMLLGIPVAFTPHGFSYLGSSGVARSLIIAVERLLARPPCLLVASSPSEATRAITEVGWNPQKVTAAFSNSIEPDEESVDHYSKDQINVLMIGRLCYQKNPEMYLRVAETVARSGMSIQFTILGAGYGFADPRAAVARTIVHTIEERQLTDVVRLKPWADTQAVRVELLNSDIYVSTSRFESFGYATAEAMEKGLPVVATRIDGSVDLVEDGTTGYLVNVDDDNDMAARIVMLARDSLQRQRMGKCGRERVRRLFNIRTNAPEIEALYRQLYSGAPAPQGATSSR